MDSIRKLSYLFIFIYNIIVILSGAQRSRMDPHAYHGCAYSLAQHGPHSTTCRGEGGYPLPGALRSLDRIAGLRFA